MDHPPFMKVDPGDFLCCFDLPPASAISSAGGECFSNLLRDAPYFSIFPLFCLYVTFPFSEISSQLSLISDLWRSSLLWRVGGLFILTTQLILFLRARPSETSATVPSPPYASPKDFIVFFYVIHSTDFAFTCLPAGPDSPFL